MMGFVGELYPLCYRQSVEVWKDRGEFAAEVS